MTPLRATPRAVIQPLSTPQPQTLYSTQNAPPGLFPTRAMGPNVRHQRNSTLIRYLDDARQGSSTRHKHWNLAEIWGRLMIKTLLVAEKKIRPDVGGFVEGE